MQITKTSPCPKEEALSVAVQAVGSQEQRDRFRLLRSPPHDYTSGQSHWQGHFDIPSYDEVFRICTNPCDRINDDVLIRLLSVEFDEELSKGHVFNTSWSFAIILPGVAITQHKAFTLGVCVHVVTFSIPLCRLAESELLLLTSDHRHSRLRSLLLITWLCWKVPHHAHEKLETTTKSCWCPIFRPSFWLSWQTFKIEAKE